MEAFDTAENGLFRVPPVKRKEAGAGGASYNVGTQVPEIGVLCPQISLTAALLCQSCSFHGEVQQGGVQGWLLVTQLVEGPFSTVSKPTTHQPLRNIGVG